MVGKRSDLKNVERSDLEETTVELDTEITPELKREGEYRELVREIQDMRKEKGLIPNDKIILTLPKKHQEAITGFETELKKTVGATEIKFGDDLDLEKI